MNKFKLVVVALCASLAAGSASAVTIFSDNFNRANSNTVGNGWSELEQNNNDVSICCGSDDLLLRDSLGGLPDAAAASTVIDATGYENISVRLRWRALRDNEGSDDFYVSWSLAPAPALTAQNLWTQVFTASPGGNSWFTTTISLGAAAADSLFNVMLWTNVTDSNAGNTEGFRVDWFRVEGDAIAPVPLPATGLLLIGALGGMGLMRRRNKS